MPTIDISKRTDGYQLALWYSEKATQNLKNGDDLFQSYKEIDSIPYYITSIEFSLKAICTYVNQKYDPYHDVSKQLIKLSKKLPEYKLHLSRAALVSSKCVGADQQYRNLTNYGNYNVLLPAKELIKKDEVKILKEDAMDACKLMHIFENKQKYNEKIKIGILNGFVDESNENEIKCNDYPWINISENDIQTRLEKQGCIVNEIPISRIDNSYPIIINPFGETYPETDLKKRTVFKLIKNYIYNGGLFVNIAGFPFFYGWNVNEGNKEPVVDIKTILIYQMKRAEMLNFSGSLLYREFNGFTTADSEEHSGAYETEIYQNEEDIKKAGELIDEKSDNKVNEFRALRKETSNLIPLLRAKRDGYGEIYPIGAISHGFGYLMVCGMNTSIRELDLIINCLLGFSNWISKIGIDEISFSY